jgi:hypothetical protein
MPGPVLAATPLSADFFWSAPAASFYKTALMSSLTTYAQVHAHLKQLRADSLSLLSANRSRVSPAAIYGFVVFIMSWLALMGYLLWAFSPGLLDSVLPSRYWAVAGPTWFCVSLVMLPLVYRAASAILQSPTRVFDAPNGDWRPPSQVPPLEIYSALR